MFAGTGRGGMEVVQGWLVMEVKLDGDGYKMCGGGWGWV